MIEKKLITIFINGRKIKAERGQTILEVANENKIFIPSLCYHSDLKVKASCRLCVVEIKNKNGLVTACSTKIEPEMNVITNSPEIRKARKINLGLLFSQHKEECHDCVWSKNNCQLLQLAKKYKVEITKFDDRKKNYPAYQFGPAVLFDSSKCIDCRNCVEVCQNQGVGFLEIEEKGRLFQVVPSKEKNKDCVYCGQCITHCPVGAFEGVGEFEDIVRLSSLQVAKSLERKDKVLIVQFAPSIRTSIGEEFGMPFGRVVTGKIVAGLKKLGFDKVFDTSTGADFTTFEESREIIERLEAGKNLPIMTSCCPAWVRYIEIYYPEFVPNLTTVRSPQIILGGLIKTYWAEKQGINPKKIVVVSIMPCVAKKYEITRPELRINGLRPVDYVLTTRELSRLFKKKNIGFSRLKPKKVDKAFDEPSGAGIIYGASGGVMESAFRTTYEKLSGQKLEKIEFEEIRGMAGIKKAAVKIGDENRYLAVISGLGNAKQILEEVKKGDIKYDCLEVMACPGGCIGGGGQPMPINEKIRKARAQGLYSIDDKKKIRRAHENPVLQKIYNNFLDRNKEFSRQILHTFYSPKKKSKIKKIVQTNLKLTN